MECLGLSVSVLEDGLVSDPIWPRFRLGVSPTGQMGRACKPVRIALRIGDWFC